MNMDFIQQLQHWEKGELLQGKIMIGMGLATLIAFVFIIRSQNEFFKGMILPLGLLLFVLIGYGGYILYSRPAHVKQSVSLYKTDENEAIIKEIQKHTNDNKAGKVLMKFVYPSLLVIAALSLLFIKSTYYRGFALGFVLLFTAIYVIDNGFVTRSDKVIQAIK